MYLSIADEEIIKRQKEVKERNEKLINYYNNLPLMKRLFVKPPDDEVLDNWYYFRQWMDERIRLKQMEERE